MNTELTVQQSGWLKLASVKENCFNDLALMEIKIQDIVNGFDTMSLEAIQKALKEGKQEAAIAKDRRLKFTNLINEKLVQPAMQFEKRNDELLAKVSSKELDLRKVAADELEKANAVHKEKAQLTAHIKNEILKIGTAYRADLEKTIGNAYINALKEKISPKLIGQYIEKTIQDLYKIELQKPLKFQRKLVSDELARSVMSEIEKYVPDHDLGVAINRLKKETFSMYEQDLNNSDAAAEAVSAQIDEAVSAHQDEWVLESSTNNLMAQVVPFELTSGVTVKKRKKIVLEESEEFAIKVLATFIAHWAESKKQIGTKSWIKLVDPFTKALDKMDTQFPNFKYEEVCK